MQGGAPTDNEDHGPLRPPDPLVERPGEGPAGPNGPATPSTPPGAPLLPAVDPVVRRVPEPTPVATSDGATTWYRSDQARSRAVYRRANPWYRRLARGLVGLTLVSLLGVGLYFGGRELQDYLQRDRLPGPGAEVPDIRRTSFQVNSGVPGPVVDGTLTIDTRSRAFEFVGRSGGPQTGLRAVSPDGSSVYVRQPDGTWQIGTGSDPLAADLTTTVRYLADDDTADAILTNRLRRGYVELVDESTEGVADDELTRYDLQLDTVAFSADYPLQWQDFVAEAIPGVQKNRSLPVTIWLDTDDVLVRVRDLITNWSWERLTYSASAFTPASPAAELLEATTGDTTPTTAP